jgi:GTP-binding protein HflX
MVPRSAVLLSLDHDVEEIQELARTAGYDIVYVVTQKRARPDPNTFLGKGKVKELKELLMERPFEAIVLNGEAKPSHHYNLESLFKVVCVDRIRLILDIFATRANSREARLQVEKARLRYETPLLKEWIHNAKAGEHPGFMGGGEYAIDIYYDLVKSRMKGIDDELEEIRRDSGTRRKHRSRRGLEVVSLAGYTNAGKSSLMRAITGEDVLVEDRMFSTLSTTTRKMSGSKDVLITDTIGFLKDLPHFMIESFRTTLEEIFNSDLILLVVDSTEDLQHVEEKLITSKEILIPRTDPSNIIIIFNKIDKLTNKNPYISLEETAHKHFPNSIVHFISAHNDDGIKDLIQIIENHFRYGIEVMAILPNTSKAQTTISYLFEIGDVMNIDYADKVQIDLRCRERDLKSIKEKVEGAGGEVKDLV